MFQYVSDFVENSIFDSIYFIITPDIVHRTRLWFIAHCAVHIRCTILYTHSPRYTNVMIMVSATFEKHIPLTKYNSKNSLRKKVSEKKTESIFVYQLEMHMAFGAQNMSENVHVYGKRDIINNIPQ